MLKPELPNFPPCRKSLLLFFVHPFHCYYCYFISAWLLFVWERTLSPSFSESDEKGWDLTSEVHLCTGSAERWGYHHLAFITVIMTAHRATALPGTTCQQPSDALRALIDVWTLVHYSIEALGRCQEALTMPAPCWTWVLAKTRQTEFGKALGGQEHTSCLQKGLTNTGTEETAL